MIKEQFDIITKSDACGHINALREEYISIDNANRLFFERGVAGFTALLSGSFVCEPVTKVVTENDTYEVLMFFRKIDNSRPKENYSDLIDENANLKEIIKKLEEKSGK